MGNHGTIECGLEIVNYADIDVNNIAEIVVGVCQESYEGHLNQPFKYDDPLQRALFSLPYAISNVLLRKSIKLEHYTEEFVRIPDISDLTKKVRIVRMKPPEQFGSASESQMKDGQGFLRVNQPPKLVTREEIKNKFLANVEFNASFTSKKAKKVLTMLENLEAIDDVANVTQLLVA
jgi:2-methylcitrate dehydratase PrpD